MNKEDLELLKNIRSYLNNIGLGTVYGNLGRCWAIIHNQLLNDNPRCYSCNNDGSRKKSDLTEDDKILVDELGSHIDHMLKHSDLYDKLNNLIIKYESI